MFGPVTKWSTRISVAESTPEIVRKAFRLARLEKPGATHIELPEDIAGQDTDMKPLEVRRTSYPRAQDAVITRALELIKSSKAPVILAGNGVARRQAAGHASVEALRRFVRRSGLPATHTYMAKGVLDPFSHQSLPAAGLQRPGAELANIPQLAEADLVIAVGYDLVEWSPSLWNPRRDKVVIHIDSTPAELDGHYQPSVEVVGELDESLSVLADHVETRKDQPIRGANKPLGATLKDTPAPFAPQLVVAAVREALAPEDIVVSDVGAHKVWLSRLYPTPVPNTVVVSNGLASMGIALPGAIAAKLVFPERKVIAFSGDGGFLMNVQELETAKRMGTAIVCIVLVDDRLGIIEANERRIYGRAFATEFGNPGFVELARAFGIAGFAVPTARELFPTLRRALDLGQPALVAVPWDYRANERIADKLP
jgi:acetolactate synthase-1/2/3 large subunit